MIDREGTHSLNYQIPEGLHRAVRAWLSDWKKHFKIRRLWERDASLWTGSDEAQWLEWLSIVERQRAALPLFQSLAEEARGGGNAHVLLLGMGGSSLCPEVMALTFGRKAPFPQLLILDSTDPVQVASIEKRLSFSESLFVVASKSGTTLEPTIFLDYFLDRVRQTVGKGGAEKRFIAITDPGSKLEDYAKREGFLHVFPGEPRIGGRFSALSHFGLVPAALMGMEVEEFLGHTEEMVRCCGPAVPVEENPGGMLGILLGAAAREGRDKVTLVISPGIYSLGAWIEQLLAESTGKSGKGLVPVDREEPGPPEIYGEDRLFVYLRLETAPEATQDRAVERLRKAGQAVVEIRVQSPCHLGQEFFRWEVATAVAGSILGIHPFDQPDVEASKVETRRLTSEFEKTGQLPTEPPLFEEGGLQFFADPKHSGDLRRSMQDSSQAAQYLKAHLDRLASGDYFAMLGYLAMTREHEGLLQEPRHRVRDRKKVATCLGFGPRFLHSTGQLYKGGPNTGVFLQITTDNPVDLPVPGKKYTFGTVKAAQALGDFRVLTERNRRALRVHLRGDTRRGLERLAEIIKEALP